MKEHRRKRNKSQCCYSAVYAIVSVSKRLASNNAIGEERDEPYPEAWSIPNWLSKRAAFLIQHVTFTAHAVTCGGYQWLTPKFLAFHIWSHEDSSFARVVSCIVFISWLRDWHIHVIQCYNTFLLWIDLKCKIVMQGWVILTKIMFL